MGDDVVHLPRDPRPLVLRREPHLLLPLDLQTAGAVLELLAALAAPPCEVPREVRDRDERGRADPEGRAG